MTEILTTLLGGTAIIVAVFLLAYKLLNISGKILAGLLAIAVTGIYIPVSIFTWQGADVFAIHIAIYLVTIYLLGIVTSQRDARRRSGEKTGGFHWAPATIIVFFAFIVAVDSIFIVMAQKGLTDEFTKWLLPEPKSGSSVTSHFPGTVSNDYHKKEAEYNEFQERFEKQQQLGWKIRKGWLNKPVAGQAAIFRIEVHDRDNQPVREAEVSSHFMWPANKKRDQQLRLSEVADGTYQASFTMPESGVWNLLAIIKHNDDVYEIRATTYVEERQ